jgi:hypothetical protein
MYNFKKITIALSLLSAAIFTTYAMAYTTGPYLNLGLGGIFISSSGNSASGGAARLGLGYLGIITDEENPVLLGGELNGDYGYTSDTSSLYGGNIAAILGKQLIEEVAIFGKLGINALGQNSNFVAGPQIGVGIGYQILPSLRVTGEGDYALDAIRIGNGEFANSTVNFFNLLIGLQYTFYITNVNTNT